MVSRFSGRDEGFSLTEFIVVLVLLGVILSISYGGLSVVLAGQETSERQAHFAREIGAPLGVMEKFLSQSTAIENSATGVNVPITSPGQYQISILTDRDHDDVVERHTYTAAADGTLIERVFLTDNQRQNVSQVSQHTWSDMNTNQATGVPLFRYFTVDSAGSMQEITDLSLVSTTVNVVQVTVVSNYEGKEFSDSRQIFLRNR